MIKPVEFVAIVDRSTSMSAIRQEAIKGYNAFLAEQKKLPDPANFTLVTFASRLNDQRPYYRESISTIQPLTEASYVPAGSTALNDALGRQICEFSKLRDEGKIDKVIFCVLTDGEENNSTEFSTPEIKALIKSCEEKYSWEFVFLVANQDAFHTANMYGVDYSNVANFAANAVGTASAFSGASMKAARYRGAAAAGLDGDALYSSTRSVNLQDTVVSDTDSK